MLLFCRQSLIECKNNNSALGIIFPRMGTQFPKPFDQYSHWPFLTGRVWELQSKIKKKFLSCGKADRYLLGCQAGVAYCCCVWMKVYWVCEFNLVSVLFLFFIPFLFLVKPGKNVPLLAPKQLWVLERGCRLAIIRPKSFLLTWTSCKFPFSTLSQSAGTSRIMRWRWLGRDIGKWGGN